MIRKLITAAAVVAAVTLTAGTAWGSPLPAPHPGIVPHATSVCAAACDDVSGELLGPSMILNASSKGGSGPFQGRIVNLRQGSNQASNEDWDADRVGFLNDFCSRYPGGNGQIPATSYACVHLAQWAPVFEAEFTPLGVSSGFCAGAFAPAAGFRLRLFPCGTARTFFVEDASSVDPGEGPTGNYVALVYAPDTSTSNPLVATAREFSVNPQHQVVLTREVLELDGAISSQLVTQAPLLVGPFS